MSYSHTVVACLVYVQHTWALVCLCVWYCMVMQPKAAASKAAKEDEEDRAMQELHRMTHTLQDTVGTWIGVKCTSSPFWRALPAPVHVSLHVSGLWVRSLGPRGPLISCHPPLCLLLHDADQATSGDQGRYCPSN